MKRKIIRRYAYLKEPLKCNSKDSIYKIMLCQYKDGVSLFEYCSPNAVRCSYDQWYPDIESVYEDWNDETDERGWIDIGEPLPNQHDAF